MKAQSSSWGESPPWANRGSVSNRHRIGKKPWLAIVRCTAQGRGFCPWVWHISHQVPRASRNSLAGLLCRQRAGRQSEDIYQASYQCCKTVSVALFFRDSVFSTSWVSLPQHCRHSVWILPAVAGWCTMGFIAALVSIKQVLFTPLDCENQNYLSTLSNLPRGVGNTTLRRAPLFWGTAGSFEKSHGYTEDFF